MEKNYSKKDDVEIDQFLRSYEIILYNKKFTIPILPYFKPWEKYLFVI